MRIFSLASSLLAFTFHLHAAIIQGGDQRMTAEEFAQVQAGCTMKSAEMVLANACYSGDMNRESSAIKFIGTAGDDNKLRYCYNALVIPSKSGVRSQVQVLRDNESGQVRAQNFVVPPGTSIASPNGKSMVLGGIEGRCLTTAKVDGPSCGGNQSLAVGYSGTPGSEISVDSLAPGGQAPRVNAESGNQDLNQIASTLVKDIDRRLDGAATALIAESTRARGASSDVLKRKAKAVADCAAAATKYRAKNELNDPAADAKRGRIVEDVGRIEAGQPAKLPAPTGGGAGSAR